MWTARELMLHRVSTPVFSISDPTRRHGACAPGVSVSLIRAKVRAVTTLPLEDTTALAGHGRRIAAAVLDAVAYVVVVGAFCVVGLLAGLAAAAATDSNGEYEGWEELGYVLLGTLVGVLAGVVFWVGLSVWLVRRKGRRNGQTLGKQMVGIRIVRADRAEVEFGLALLREFAAKWLLIWVVSAGISALLGFFDGGSIGFLLAVAIFYGPAFFDDQRRALHDRMCYTRVVVAAPGPPVPVVPAGDDLWPANVVGQVGEAYTLGEGRAGSDEG